MVAIGPTLAIIAILEEPIKRIPFVIKNEGNTVAMIATPTPNKYTGYGNEKISKPYTIT